ncbi:YdeI/OmpD-associated family protein [Microbaculum marinisediminis]|uniref:YdeI/OmpD-associated family protein n=1 Tax=Microbaculum marinisediminis TaxID=2931392 RepID=A0AAW5R215_9HYPH|nr:YdeI/OmpD-associated family protein [Microbaculum sp. A6E488]MCT8974013.1 YdeI/OmpD-associated family protein [Microbaculum sp. A6E488]
MITEIEDYFAKGCGRCARFGTEDCSTKRWEPGLAKLRDICLSSDLTETVKWGHPCYMHADRNIAIIGAFQDNFRLSFFNEALMKDPEGVLEKAGPNTQHPGTIRFTSNDGPEGLETIIRAYLDEAKGYAEAGTKPPKDESALELPDELVDALDADPELAEAFHALTRGRQKSYVINLNSAKKSETRASRIEKFRDRIIAGKGATER